LNFLANEVNCIFVAKVQNMATLSGQKVKDAFASLLKLSSNTATTTLKNVESGDGVATALQIGTTKVGVNGTLEFPTVPATGSTELDVLLLNASNQVIKRTLNTSAFTGGGLTTASLPLGVSGSDVRLANPSLITDIGTPASGDRFLIYDASATTWKRIDYSALAAFVNPGGYQSAPELVARTRSAIALNNTPKYLEFANIGITATDSLNIGSAASVYSFTDAYGGTNSGVRVLVTGVYEITLCAALVTAGTNVDVTLFFDVNGVNANTNQTAFKNAGDHFITQSTIANLTEGDALSVRATASSSTELEVYSVFHLRKL
jgi:hypothetical protein